MHAIINLHSVKSYTILKHVKNERNKLQFLCTQSNPNNITQKIKKNKFRGFFLTRAKKSAEKRLRDYRNEQNLTRISGTAEER